jgi:uncharacterized protein (DUF2252 family)
MGTVTEKMARNTRSVRPASGPSTHADLVELGKRLREKCPRRSHASWKMPPDRPDPVTLLERSSEGRIPELIPVRYGRMMESPFAWYRGTALNMAADLAGTPVSGLRVQACGDAHLANFGVYASPERRAIFDLTDFDETLPAPWEWDVKRLGASVVLACRSNSFREDLARDAVLACVRSYRERMLELSEMRALDVWYADQDLEALIAGVEGQAAGERARKRLARARRRGLTGKDYPELVRGEDGEVRIQDNPPLIYHWGDHSHDDVMAAAREAFGAYRRTLPEHVRVLLDRFQLTDIAIKVVGVGSVGTLCFVMLLMAGEHDPLFLQVKEARASVLEPYAGTSPYPNHGQRIVTGCLLMQSTSDIFLGWTRREGGRDFYIRQLKDLKLKPMIEEFTPEFMQRYAGMCGGTLANAHARSGEPARIAGYLGKNGRFDEAIAAFSTAYADQSEQDHAALVRAVRGGRLEAASE